MAASERNLGKSVSSRKCWGLGLLIAVMITGLASPAPGFDQELQMLAKENIYFYFPEDETDLAQALADECESMTAFLAQRGLPPARPLHIVLDEDLDAPRVDVSIIPHREIRIPLRAPGVLEDGYLEPNPWRYFMFMGLSMQGMFSERSKIPGAVYYVFGEIISPNLILPDWTIDGISHLLYEEFEKQTGRASTGKAPMDRSIMLSSPAPDLDKVSNHPEIWPGRLSYRIYGRPFIRWLHEQYGWNKIMEFLRVHGGGILPIEIDRKVRNVFGASPGRLWKQFASRIPSATGDVPPPEPKKNAAFIPAHPLTGYWPEPFVYWNDTGVYPGLVRSAVRGRYGYVDQRGRLRLSRYENGIARLTAERGDTLYTAPRKHVWDPGPGEVAVTRKGRRPWLVLNTPLKNTASIQEGPASAPGERLIPAPAGVIQLSGPVTDAHGRIAVAGNTGGNWDIWLYDGNWQRITTTDSVELDPWFADGQVIFASNTGGRFQLHQQDMRQLTHVSTAAILPRGEHFLELAAGGWILRSFPEDLLAEDIPEDNIPEDNITDPRKSSPTSEETGKPAEPASDYSPWKSIWPNYVAPDLYVDADNFQFGIATKAQDVSRRYGWDAGVRYSVNDSEYDPSISWRLGGMVNGFSARATHYRLSYTTARRINVDEMRDEIKFAWSPQRFKNLEAGVNWRRYDPAPRESYTDDEWWGSLNYSHAFSNFSSAVTLDWFTDDSQSLYGELIYWFGQHINTVIHLQAGKTWGDLQPGHNSFRIGGSSGEGFFTQRTSRLFAIRGFDSSILDAAQAATASVEVFWPLARLQAGYQTLPLFLHNLSLGTFVDSGFATDNPGEDEILVSAGFELITGMELAWGFMADFRLGWAWPLRQPDDLDQEGPRFLIQIGRPL